MTILFDLEPRPLLLQVSVHLPRQSHHLPQTVAELATVYPVADGLKGPVDPCQQGPILPIELTWRRHLLPDGQILQRFEVRSSSESRAVRHEIVRLVGERFGGAGHLELVLDEVLTNAVYHAPADPQGRPKYERYAEVRLEQAEFVEAECGFDTEKYGVAVTDHSGRLSKETVLQRIDRHVSGMGLMDEHGRGIHLSRVFSDRLIINIKPGVKTEVVMLNYFTQKYRGFKPLYINEL